MYKIAKEQFQLIKKNVEPYLQSFCQCFYMVTSFYLPMVCTQRENANKNILGNSGHKISPK